MDIVADANLALLDETFARHGRIKRLPGRWISAEHVRGADILLVRSVTRVNEELLKDSGVRFVGTATIGTDHLDLAWLEANDICWASAPGCNADAAAQYSLAMALEACRRLGTDPRELQAGIIGRGNVGSRLQALLRKLDVPAVACDPPLADIGVKGLVSLEEALAQPLVSLHVPLTRDGPCPTFQMLDKLKLARLPDGALLINTSRGDVIDGAALLDELRRSRVHAALDVWPGEPGIDPMLMEHCAVATPHVAGYSVEGKQNGTLMIYRAFCQWAGVNAEAVEAGAMRDDPSDHADLLALALAASKGVAADDRAMRSALKGLDHPAPAFDELRRNYRLRRDFGTVTV